MSYRIAYFMTDNDSIMAGKICDSVRAYCAKAQNIEVSVFTCFGGTSLKGSGQGEYEIVNLPDLTLFDGVVMHASQYQMPSVLDMLIRKLYDSEITIPLVSIDIPLKGADIIGTDNHAAMADMVSHLVDECGARRLAFIEGPMDNREAYERLRAFEEVCNGAGISEEDLCFLDGTWSADSGAAAMSKLIELQKDLPDAVVCANDDMALGAANICRIHGIRIPDDILLTGFDDTIGARLFEPQLSTVSRNTLKVVEEAFSHIVKKIERQQVRSRCFIPHSLKLRGSTGHTENEAAVGLDFVRRMYRDEIKGIHPEGMSLTEFMSRMFEARSLGELMGLIEDNVVLFGCSRFYLCLNDSFVASFGEPDAPKYVHFDGKMRLMVCSPCTMEADRFHVYSRFERNKLLPDEIDQEGHVYCYYPLHHTQYCFGYIAVEHDLDSVRDVQQKTALIMIAAAIENLRKRKQMRRLNRDLEHLYVKDALTGLYNRFGLDNEGEELYRVLREKNEDLYLYFFDIDNMKSINDTFGHDVGDTCLTQAAGVLEKSIIQAGAENSSFVMRYSGDEFVVFGAGLDKGFEEYVLEGVDLMNRESFTPFHLSFSFEKEKISADNYRELEYYIHSAEKRMKE